jgi:hypothetical protein
MWKEYSQVYSQDIVYPVKTSAKAEPVLVMTEDELRYMARCANKDWEGEFFEDWLARRLKGE